MADPSFGLPDDASDPAADFLKREQEMLGDDAALFAGAPPSSSSAVPPLSAAQGHGADMLNGFTDTAHSTSNTGFDAFDAAPAHGAGGESPLVAASSVVVQGGDSPVVAGALDTNPTALGLTSPQSASSLPSIPVKEEEPEVIKQWRATFQSRISKIDAHSQEKKEQTLAKAKSDLAKFYKEYEEKKKKSINKNRDIEKESEMGSGKGTTWERVLRQIESFQTPTTSSSAALSTAATAAAAASQKSLSGSAAGGTAGAGGNKHNTKDTARLKQLMVSLKGDLEAPCNSSKTTAAA